MAPHLRPHLTASFLVLLYAATALADGSLGARPDAHAPIGVMGDHLHARGEWMLSYRYARMRMDGNRSSTRHRKKSDVLDDFMVTPTDMDVNVHMWGLMFAPTSNVTLAAMVPLLDKEMDHLRRDGVTFETSSDSIGDVKLTGLVKLWESGGHHVHLNAGLSFPTGSTTERDGGRDRLPYPMQIGSGSWDLLPGLTYTGHGDSERLGSWSWGAQALGVVRTARNDRDYRLGNRVDVTAWLARPLTSWLSVSARTQWMWWDNIHGDDDSLDPILVPTAAPDRRGGHRLDLLAGLNFLLPVFSDPSDAKASGDGAGGRKPSRYGHRLSIEAGFPAHQWLDGPQLESDWRVVVGWQKAFKPFSFGPLR